MRGLIGGPGKNKEWLRSEHWTNDGWMNGVLGHFLCTVKAELGRGQPGLMRWIWDETLPQSSIDRSTFYWTNEWMNEWINEWMNEWNKQINGWMKKWKNEWTKNKWRNEGMEERMTKWVNECKPHCSCCQGYLSTHTWHPQGLHSGMVVVINLQSAKFLKIHFKMGVGASRQLLELKKRYGRAWGKQCRHEPHRPYIPNPLPLCCNCPVKKVSQCINCRYKHLRVLRPSTFMMLLDITWDLTLKPTIWKIGSTTSVCIGCSNNTAANSRLSAWGFKVLNFWKFTSYTVA